MVLVGLERNVGLFREANTYGNVLETAVTSNPDSLSAEELHAAAWPVAAEHFAEDKRNALERFASLHGTGQASVNADKIQVAAQEGRVETLFVAREPSVWSQGRDGRSAVVTLGAEPALADEELFDRAVLDTLTNGGKVYEVEDSSVLDGQLMAATFRY